MASTPRRSKFSKVLLILFRILFTVFAALTTVFIFKNSLESGALSSERSHDVAVLLNSLLGRAGIAPLSEYAVRKLAHFSEFALLGFWFSLCLRVYTRHYIRHISWPLLLVLLIANMDETIQLYVANRAGMVSDVWIDFLGGMGGTLCAFLMIALLDGFWYLLGFGRHPKME